MRAEDAPHWWLSENAAEHRKDLNTIFIESMASCTAITYVHEELVGDPLDVKMFQSTGWVLDETAQQNSSADDQLVLAYVYPNLTHNSGAEDLQIKQLNFKSALIRRFDFSSALQRMSTICKNEFDNKYKAFVKGSPEKISELCLPHSLPPSFNDVMSSYTKEGYRVIALAYKELPDLTYRQAHRIEREAVESELTFLGLLVMENKLKPETIGVIQNLNECGVRTIMATGDNVLTAISVARQCAILNDQKEVFLAEVIQDRITGEDKIEWKSTMPDIPSRPNETSQSNKKVNNSTSTFSEDDIKLIRASPDRRDPLNHKSLPWNYKDETLEVAMTGKAFRMIEANREADPFTFKSVLAKA